MSDGNDTTNTILVVCFGILTILVTIAGFHVRDSVFCSCFRGLFVTWSQGEDVDIEARAGLVGRSGYQDDAVEMQPRLTLPLYYEPPLGVDHGESGGQ
ncbi:hypothetical protein EK21DRAFT_106925 [Setomelanomma holmii]|uniref:Uncharacterized protein n=1 Tax=Setomelanomma holmii TaxID=210430 RepID=A0A9P4HJH4_9PLEO|nr:hypothetical protein EK21DRAFT_106925 [Setomelanomma holmii]